MCSHTVELELGIRLDEVIMRSDLYAVSRAVCGSDAAFIPGLAGLPYS
jgi:hypothetical protein